MDGGKEAHPPLTTYSFKHIHVGDTGSIVDWPIESNPLLSQPWSCDLDLSMASGSGWGLLSSTNSRCSGFRSLHHPVVFLI